ncbi:hypothetical protein QWZ10_14655 [Paracoccus cavernae]|uniref:Uncharacterized protein n=1 Tax=Paracoccus cavernae TaxID=1571207 RepID=A0ABT8DBE8_9RHOB|nr:hypothetical protein [Paracoccus cavernae]
MILLRPYWLLALLALAALAVLRWRRGPDAGGWEAVLSPVMLAGLAALGQLGTGGKGAARFCPMPRSPARRR